MKGVIVTCLRAMVMTKFGKDKWDEALTAAGFEKNASFLVTEDIEDATVMKLLEASRKVLGITPDQAAEAFGEYWVGTYAAKIYKPYFEAAATAKEFLLNMDEVHRTTTENIPNARPPRFEYAWQDSKTLLMKYKSQRNLIDLLAALVKGVGKHFKEDLRVTKQSGDTLKIVFS